MTSTTTYAIPANRPMATPRRTSTARLMATPKATSSARPARMFFGYQVTRILGFYLRCFAMYPSIDDAMMAHWPERLGEVANAMLEWRLQRAAPVFAKSLTDSP